MPAADDLPEPWRLDGDAFAEAQARAVGASGGVLSGRHVLTGGTLYPSADQLHHREGVRILVGEHHPGAIASPFGPRPRWWALVDHDEVVAEVTCRTTARHRDGVDLTLVTSRGDTVVAHWYRGPAELEEMRHLPAGFVWEKNDDYYYGDVSWADLSDVRIEVDVVRAGPAALAPDGAAAVAGAGPVAPGVRHHYRRWARLYAAVAGVLAVLLAVGGLALSGENRSAWMLVPPAFIVGWAAHVWTARLEWSKDAITRVHWWRRRRVTPDSLADVAATTDDVGRVTALRVTGSGGRPVTVQVFAPDPAFAPIRAVVQRWAADRDAGVRRTTS